MYYATRSQWRCFWNLEISKNKRDQQRLVLQNNRQALAKWIAEGIVTDYKKGEVITSLFFYIR